VLYQQNRLARTLSQFILDSPHPQQVSFFSLPAGRQAILQFNLPYRAQTVKSIKAGLSRFFWIK
jgi:hypothetical protein